MKEKFIERQIVASIKKQESCISVKDICRESGISDATIYNWKARYGGMEASDVIPNRYQDFKKNSFGFVISPTWLPCAGAAACYSFMLLRACARMTKYKYKSCQWFGIRPSNMLQGFWPLRRIGQIATIT